MNKFVYVGCGNHRLKGFIHIDVDYAKRFKKGEIVNEPDFICDISEKLPFDTNSVDLIFSRETLEHLTYRELNNHLIEAYRVLKINGKLRIAVPDLDLMVKHFLEKKEKTLKEKDAWEISEDFPLNNHSEFFVAQIMYHDHRYNHNFETLSSILKKVGFSNIVKSNGGDFDINNNLIYDQIKGAEINGTNLLFITAEKKKEKSIGKKFIFKNNSNIINKILSKFFNLKITASNHRKPHFPQKNYFLEKIFLLKKLIKKN